jgi:5S rRNA maturation endonuclease (ribonuclease M5)
MDHDPSDGRQRSPSRRDRAARSTRERTGADIVDTERAERLRALLQELADVNRLGVPVVVEGRRDAEALASLGLVGEVVAFNRGQGVHDFCEDMAARYADVVLLTDWDDSGSKLQSRLERDLAGLWEAHASFRQRFRAICQKEVKDVEGIPRLLLHLEGRHGPLPEGSL